MSSLWLRLPPWFPRPHFHFSPPPRTTIAVALTSIGVATSNTVSNGAPIPIWASLSLSTLHQNTFPQHLQNGQHLMGVGLRKASILGLKKLDIYVFGVYADGNDVKQLRDKYGEIPVSELQNSKDFVGDVLDGDIRMTVKLEIVYGRLSMGSVRSAFEKSVGSRLTKFSGSHNKHLLHSFISMFKDEYKLPKGSVIEISREKGYILQTKIDGKVVGHVESKLLCQSVLDLYFGEDPFDSKAKEDIQYGLASIVQE